MLTEINVSRLTLPGPPSEQWHSELWHTRLAGAGGSVPSDAGMPLSFSPVGVDGVEVDGGTTPEPSAVNRL